MNWLGVRHGLRHCSGGVKTGWRAAWVGGKRVPAAGADWAGTHAAFTLTALHCATICHLLLEVLVNVGLLSVLRAMTLYTDLRIIDHEHTKNAHLQALVRTHRQTYRNRQAEAG